MAAFLVPAFFELATLTMYLRRTDAPQIRFSSQKITGTSGNFATPPTEDDVLPVTPLRFSIATVDL